MYFTQRKIEDDAYVIPKNKLNIVGIMFWGKAVIGAGHKSWNAALRHPIYI